MKATIIFAIMLIIGTSLITWSLTQRDPQLGAVQSDWNVLAASSTNSSTTVRLYANLQADGYEQNPTLLLSHTSQRRYSKICVLEECGMFVHLATATSTGIGIDEGIFLGTTTPCYEIGMDNLWLGNVYGVSHTATCTASILDITN